MPDLKMLKLNIMIGQMHGSKPRVYLQVVLEMDKKTFIVLGCPRSGTSMMAGLLRIIGIDMGDNIKEDKHEDKDILWK